MARLFVALAFIFTIAFAQVAEPSTPAPAAAAVPSCSAPDFSPIKSQIVQVEEAIRGVASSAASLQQKLEADSQTLASVSKKVESLSADDKALLSELHSTSQVLETVSQRQVSNKESVVALAKTHEVDTAKLAALIERVIKLVEEKAAAPVAATHAAPAMDSASQQRVTQIESIVQAMNTYLTQLGTNLEKLTTSVAGLNVLLDRSEVNAGRIEKIESRFSSISSNLDKLANERIGAMDASLQTVSANVDRLTKAFEQQLAQASRPLSERLSLFWADFIVIFKNMLNYIIEHSVRVFQLVRTQSGTWFAQLKADMPTHMANLKIKMHELCAQFMQFCGMAYEHGELLFWQVHEQLSTMLKDTVPAKYMNAAVLSIIITVGLFAFIVAAYLLIKVFRVVFWILRKIFCCGGRKKDKKKDKKKAAAEKAEGKDQ